MQKNFCTQEFAAENIEKYQKAIYSSSAGFLRCSYRERNNIGRSFVSHVAAAVLHLLKF